MFTGQKCFFILVFSVLVVFSSSLLTFSEEKTISFFQGFENEGSNKNVSFWCGGPPYSGEKEESCADIEKELNTEYVHSGKKSLKLKLKIKKGDWNYWEEKLDIPLTKQVYFSGYILPKRLPPGTTVALGVFWRSPEGTGGNIIPMSYQVLTQSDQWIFQEGDVLLPIMESCATVNPDSPAYLEGWAIYIWGKFKKEEVELYVDDIRIEDMASRLRRIINDEKGVIESVAKSIKPDDTQRNAKMDKLEKKIAEIEDKIKPIDELEKKWSDKTSVKTIKGQWEELNNEIEQIFKQTEKLKLEIEFNFP